MEYLIYAAIGGIAGFIRSIITGKGLIALPKLETKGTHKFLNLGFIAPIIIGCFAGWVAPYRLGVDSAVAGLAGYCGADIIENLVESALGKKIGR